MKKLFAITVLSTFLLLGLPSLAVLAGDGSGGKNDSAFDIVSSTVENGEKDVNTDREIKFVFSKNVANISVAEKNRRCFSMTDSSGNVVPIEVVTCDDQLEREKRNDVVIKPESLKDAEEYTITISPDLHSKNGVTLGKEIKYTFSTPGYAAQEAAADSASAASNFSQWWIVIIILVVVAAVFVYMKRRR